MVIHAITVGLECNQTDTEQVDFLDSVLQVFCQDSSTRRADL